MDNDGTATTPSAPSPVEDPFALLAEGTFPTHAPRPPAAPVSTIYGLDDRCRGIKGGRRVLFMHPEDLAARGWKAGQRVTITSHFPEERRKARGFQLVSYPIPRRRVASYFPEANVLVPVESVAAESNTPTYKSIHVSLERAE